MVISFTVTAVCNNPCHNGGTYTAPNTCTCVVGWTGTKCETGGCNTIIRTFDKVFA